MSDAVKRLRDPELDPLDRFNQQDWEVVPAAETAVAAARLGAMISVRLDPGVARLVRQAARAEGISQSEFVRRATEERARQIVEQEPVRIVAHDGTTPTLVWNPTKAVRPLQEEVVSGSAARSVVALKRS